MATYYISPSGNDTSGAGTLASPWRTFGKLWGVMAAGDQGYIRGGTYTTASQMNVSSKNGTSGSPIRIWAYPGDATPVFDFTATADHSAKTGLQISSSSFIHLKGIRITGITQYTSNACYGMILSHSHDCTIEFCEFDHIGGYGFAIDQSPNNLILNCDAHHNADPLSAVPYDGSNGFGVTAQTAGTSGGNIFRYCRAWWNSDDGFDTFNTVDFQTFDGCWAFWNGYIPGTFNTAGNGDGFKIGQSPSLIATNLRLYKNNLSFENRFMGFDQNFTDNSHMFPVTMYNNTAYGNKNLGFFFSLNAANVIKNNLAFTNNNNGQQANIGGNSTQANNSWLGAVTVSNADFASISSTGMDGARQSDGSLPILSFMHLATGSDLINAGVNVGLPFSGAAPDMGCFEFGGVTNVPPIVNAGTDKTITLPTSSVTMNGSVTDSDGSITNITWTKISGGTANITTLSSPTTTVTGLAAGSYVFQLSATDNLNAVTTDSVSITVNPAPPINLPPVADAGVDKNITLPTNTVTCTGSGTDPDGSISSYAWTKISGPATFTIASPTAATTAINNLIQGSYVFRLTVTDNQGATAFDNVTVIVNPANIPPIADAGPNQTITLPTNSVTLTGVATDSDGTIASRAWTRVSGPNTPTITTPTALSTTVTGMIAGTYVFRLTVTDNVGSTGTDTVSILVNPVPNVPPISHAGANQTITLPTSSVTLSGSGTDTDGTIASYAWTKTSGPATFTITSPTSASTTVTGLVAGTYVFSLQVTDNLGATASSTTTIVVNASAPPNNPPISNAGVDKTITLPTSSVSLTGSGTDTDGTIAAYSWSQLSGPNTGTIVSASSATTNITGLIEGTYVFRLTVTDNLGSSGTDSATVIVNPLPNVAPVVDAGINQNIILPTTSVTLSGSATDSDGTIASYLWTRVSGPNTPTITTAAAASTTVTGLVQGTYVFQLTATDNDAATGSDTMSVVVSPAPTNQPPQANAGVDKVIQLPVDSVALVGSGSDADGTIASYLWTKLSGPSTYTINTATSSTALISDLVQGTYVFQLTVTDDDGASDDDTVTVQVNPEANTAPSVEAGNNQTITFPSSSVTLAGSATDDGAIAAYAWTRVSGPTTYFIVSPSSATTVINNLVEGTYVFKLTATDNLGLSASDNITITVNPASTATIKIQAEAYTSKFGPVNEVCSDTGGGLDLRYSNRNTYANYNVNVPVSGTYTMSFRVASSHTGAQFQLRKTNGTVLTGVSVPNTGGSQIWTTVTKTVSLTAGTQTVRIYSTKSISWRINWFTLTKI